MKKTLSLCLLSGGLLAPNVFAEERGGFYLSGGLGLSLNSFKAENSALENNSGNGVGVNFKIGGYLNPQVALYYMSDVSVWLIDDTSLVETAYASGLGGLGLSYYFQPDRGSYIEAGFGFGTFIASNTWEEATADGYAFSFGGGYEVTEHIQIGLNAIFTSTTDTLTSSAEYSTSSLVGKIEFKL